MKKINRKFVYSFIIMSFALILNNACKKEDNNNPVIPATVIDIDGNVYHTVTIGTQVWMVENLNTTRYSNGDTIPNVTDYTQWGHLTTDAYCNYSNSSGQAITYGRLYNWYTINDPRKIAPAGWHIPYFSDWLKLMDYLGGDSIAGGKLKETGTKHWRSPNYGASNETGFTALPGGMRAGYHPIIHSYGFFGYILSYGLWWTASEAINDNAMYILMSDFSNSTSYGYRSKEDGLSVRCIKD